MDKIKWDRFFDFSSDSPLKRLRDEMQETIDMAEKMVSSFKRSNDQYTKEMNEIQIEAKQTTDALKKMNLESDKSGDELAKSAKKADSMASSMHALTVMENENNKAITKLTGSVNDLKKAKDRLEKTNINETNSLNDLQKRLREADAAYRALGDSSDKSVKKQHLDNVRELARQFNTANKAVNEAKKVTKEVTGSYNELTQRVSAAKRELKEMGDGFDKNSPKVQSLKKFIKASSDQLKEFDKSLGDNQREVGNYGLAIEALDGQMGGLISMARRTGAELLALFKNPWVAGAAVLIGTFAALRNAANTYYTTTVEGQEALEKSTIKSEAFGKVFRDEWADVGKKQHGIWETAKMAFREFIKDVTEDEAVRKKFEEIDKGSDELAERIRQNRRDHNQDIIDDAKTELQVNELLEKTKDKIRYSDEQRLNFLRQANKLLNEQMDGDIELAKADVQIQKDRMALIKTSIEDNEKLAQLEAAVTNVQSAASVRRKALLKQEIALVEEIEKAKRDAIEREFQANQSLNKLLIQDDIRAQEEIVRNRESSTEEKYAAVLEANKRIGDLREIEKQNEIRAAEEATAERIRAEGKNVEELLAKDEALRIQKLAIDKKYDQIEEDDARKSTEQLEKILFDDFKDYQEKFQGESLQDQIDYLRTYLAMAASYGQDTVEIEKALRKLELDLQKENNKEKLENEKEFQQAMAQLRQQAYQTARDLASNFFEKEAIELDSRRNRLETAQAKELELAGNNADAKAAIDSKYASQFQEIENQQREVRRKRAIADKALASFEIFIKTVQAVAEAGFITPTAIAIGVTGALALTAVLTKPIPQFSKGTDFSPEGLALVSEEGPELVKKPGQRPVLYDTEGAALTYLPRGSKVYTAEETESLLEGTNFDRMTDIYSGASKSVGVRKSSVSSKESQKKLVIDNSDVIAAIERNAPPDYVRIGNDIFDVKKAKDGSKAYIRSKSMSS